MPRLTIKVGKDGRDWVIKLFMGLLKTGQTTLKKTYVMGYFSSHLYLR